MATTELKTIFLSASIPLPERDSKYYETADIIAIRDAVIALVTLLLPNYKLVWGGHPSITPLVYYVLQKMRMDIDIQEHVVLFQSKFFEGYFPKDNDQFNNVILTDNLGDRDLSLELMRRKMLEYSNFSAGVFIGGMEGVEEEFHLFSEFYPNALILPVGSTGAAARLIYDNHLKKKNERFIKDYAYLSLFQEYIFDKIR